MIVSENEGLRARKRRETRARIAEAGLRLFFEQGFEATTLEAIAQAANISRRTFFHYFTSKEDILAAWESGAEEKVRAAIAAAPSDRPPMAAVRAALIEVANCFASDEAVAMSRLMHSTEALRARKQANFVHHEQMLYEALIARWPTPGRRRALRLVAMAGIGVLRIVADEWAEMDGAGNLADHLAAAFAEFEAEARR